VRNLLIAALCGLSVVPVAAQGRPSPDDTRPPNWIEVTRDASGMRVSVDSASLERTAESSWLVATRFEFSERMPMERGGAADREVDLEEVDCAAARSRTLATALLLGDSTVLSRRMSGRWQNVSADRQTLFQSRCAFLRESFAARLDVVGDVSRVEVRPALVNGSEVQRSLVRNYPAELRNAERSATVSLVVVLDVEGRPLPGTIEVLESGDAAASAAARRVLEGMRFRPARVGGRAVPVRVVLPIVFNAVR
jgi:TonB family protein